GKIAVITGGTADIPVAEEAATTCEVFGNNVERIYDVGVAGIHRLLSKIDIIR
ncbi:MAG TPA: 1-(5-phosphoribosyl)-5-amino-4-imidazole-carboxylate carboxylase, partial [Clostridiaceae bacterium]|nr:1-(5-phosphoribosyl)-5-amino-4-imidazole-carboxylate carboxylase [Clostridiaceae bacterium]